MITLSDEQWVPIDCELFVGHRLQAVIKLRTTTPLSLYEAAYALMDRFAVLRETQPHKFTVDLDTFWDNFDVG